MKGMQSYFLPANQQMLCYNLLEESSVLSSIILMNKNSLKYFLCFTVNSEKMLIK
jgi:hypothetical protein